MGTIVWSREVRLHFCASFINSSNGWIGFCQVPQGYANGLKGTSPLDIRYDKNVLSVNIHDPDDMEDDRSMEDAKGLVKIVCQDGSIIRCDAAVITVPLGVLKVFHICQITN